MSAKPVVLPACRHRVPAPPLTSTYADTSPVPSVTSRLLSRLLAIACQVAREARCDELAEIVAAVLDRQYVIGCRRVRVRVNQFRIQVDSAVVTRVGGAEKSCPHPSVRAVAGAAHRSTSIGGSMVR
jgi:hypothetical protein